MTQSPLLRSTAFILSALIVLATWLPVITVPVAHHTILVTPLA